MNSKQLELFAAAPGTKRSGGRGVSRRAHRDAVVRQLVAGAMARGCTHVEVSTHGAMFITPDALGRIAGATYALLGTDSAERCCVEKLPALPRTH